MKQIRKYSFWVEFSFKAIDILCLFPSPPEMCSAVEAGGGGQRIVMSGTELMEWHQTNRNHVFNVFDNIPLIPLQPLPRACPPQLRCHQPPVVFR
jgi:hypothetical protein